MLNEQQERLVTWYLLFSLKYFIKRLQYANLNSLKVALYPTEVLLHLEIKIIVFFSFC